MDCVDHPGLNEWAATEMAAGKVCQDEKSQPPSSHRSWSDQPSGRETGSGFRALVCSATIGNDFTSYLGNVGWNEVKGARRFFMHLSNVGILE